MHFNYILYSILLLVLVTPSKSFTKSKISSSSPQCKTNTGGIGIRNNCQLFMSSATPQNGGEKRKVNNEQFLEEASRLGYDKIKSISIEERTRRAMLAEAAEDRVVMLSDELDSLLGDDGMPLKVEYREEVTILAKQIKASREQYQKLVNGEDCASLNLFVSSQSGKKSSSSDDTMDLQ